MQGGAQFIPSSTGDPHGFEARMDEQDAAREATRARRRHGRHGKSHRPLSWLHLRHER